MLLSPWHMCLSYTQCFPQVASQLTSRFPSHHHLSFSTSFLLLRIPPLLPLPDHSCLRCVCILPCVTQLTQPHWTVFGSMQICHKFCCHLINIRLKIHLFSISLYKTMLKCPCCFLYCYVWFLDITNICFYSMSMWIYLRVGDMTQLVKRKDQSSDTQHPHRNQAQSCYQDPVLIKR